MVAESEAIGVLCVDDNSNVADALKLKLSRLPPFRWKGWLPAADALVETAIRECPDVILLDLDMPGRDPFLAMAEVVDRCTDSRVVVFSGHVRMDLIDKAMQSGAWGYASKNDGEDELIHVMRAVAAGDVAFSSEVRATYDRR